MPKRTKEVLVRKLSTMFYQNGWDQAEAVSALSCRSYAELAAFDSVLFTAGQDRKRMLEGIRMDKERKPPVRHALDPYAQPRHG